MAIAEGQKGVIIKCMSNGCETADILKALGLTFSDLFRDKATPEIHARLVREDQRENIERRLGLVMWLSALDPDWAGVEKRIKGELVAIRCRMEPQKIYLEYQGREFQRRVKRLGWDKLWQEVGK